MSRGAEIEAGLTRVRARIASACAEAGRAEGEVRLVVVTKFFPASDVRVLAGLGVTEVGESRHQEAEAKQAECADLDLVWHFIGGLQSNKAAAVTAYADVVQSVDRAKLAGPLARGAHEHDRAVSVLLQVSLDPPGDEGGRAGVAPGDLDSLADAVQEAAEQHGGRISLRGLMAVAPRDGDAREAFARLGEVHRSWSTGHPDATWLSAGMSGDLEHAVLAGATHVRVGSAVLGPRPAVK